MKPVPVIAIDGPTASGKGTVAQGVAKALGLSYLDSGALYRLVALRALETGVPLDQADRLARLAGALRPVFEAGRIRLIGPAEPSGLGSGPASGSAGGSGSSGSGGGRDVTEAIRAEEVGAAASRIAVHAPLRAALLDLQRSFRTAPGLVADGRDMGTVVFPDAELKVFLTAGVEERAKRRHKQLSDKGISANLAALLADLRERDERDSTRAAAPMRPAEDAYQFDSSALSAEEVVAQIVDWYRKR